MEARLLDLSLSGALLHLTAPLPEGGIHDFMLNLDGESVWVQGEVLRSRPAERGGYQVAVEFIGIAPEHLKALTQYVLKRT
ncbi:MAG TPA: PilZ domain-containing protein [Vicinamibacteria bacterium]|nr:PilZ domain-containing protein [Vicinamibacteria bacterium]